MTIVSESIHIDAPAEVVFDLVTNVARMGEWSPEATGTLGKTGVVSLGDKFWGTNSRAGIRWMTECTVTAADRPSTFEFLVDFKMLPISRWRYDIEADQEGCVVTESWEDRRVGLKAIPIKVAGQLLIPGPRPEHNRRNIATSLTRLKDKAEAASTKP